MYKPFNSLLIVVMFVSLCCAGALYGNAKDAEIKATCGDSQVKGREVCDPPDYKGETCMTQGYTGGTLGCAAGCQSLDTSNCTGERNEIPVVDEPPDYLYVRFPRALVTEKFVERTGFNHDEINSENWAYGYLPLKAKPILSEFGIMERSMQILDENLLRHVPFDRETLEILPDKQVSLLEVNPTLINPSSYHNYNSLYLEMKDLESRFSSIMKLYTPGYAWLNITCPDAAHPRVPSTSTCRRQLWVMRISSTPTLTSDKTRMIYFANMHGDEVIGRELMFRLIELIGTGTDSDPEITSMLIELRNNAEIFMMPSTNPDGYEKTKRNDCWSSSGTSHTTCYTGLDLNRNFPNKETGQSDSSSGKAIETVSMMDMIFKYKPESYSGTKVALPHPFVVGASFHGGSTVMNLPWDTCRNDGGTPTTNCYNNYPDNGAIFDEDLEIKSLGREYADLNPVFKNSGTSGSFYQGLTYGFEWYKITGGAQDWSIVYPTRDSQHITVEVTATKWPSFSSSTEGVAVSWNNNKKALVTYLYRALKGVHLKVQDASGQPINSATVTVNGRPIVYSNTNLIHRAAGRTTISAIRGYVSTNKAGSIGSPATDTSSNLSVTIAKSGYQSQVISVAPTYFNGSYLTVTLVP